MWEDPIVTEVRKAREELARCAGNDIERFLELLHEADRKRLAAVKPRSDVGVPEASPGVGS